MTLVLIYFGIGIALAFAALYLIKNPPEYDLQVDMVNNLLKLDPTAVGIIIFFSLTLFWLPITIWTTLSKKY